MLDAASRMAMRVASRLHMAFGDPLNEPSQSIDVNGRSVGYRVIRDDSAAEQSATLVVALHGFGADERQIDSLLPLHQVDNPIVYVAPRAPWAIRGGGYGWFPISGDSPTNLQVDPEDVSSAVDELVDFIVTARAEFNLGDQRVWIIGYSQGASVALHLAAGHPGLVAGCAVGAGTLLTADPLGQGLEATHVMLAASTIDPFISIDDYEVTCQTFRDAGATVTLSASPAPHVISAAQATAIGGWLSARLQRDGTAD